MSELHIRAAEPADAERILGFITELAIYEQAEQEVVATVDEIRARLFGDGATVYALMAEVEDEPIGFAVYFLNFSTWLGRHGIFLEDLYITPAARGQGHATRAVAPPGPHGGRTRLRPLRMERARLEHAGDRLL